MLATIATGATPAIIPNMIWFNLIDPVKSSNRKVATLMIPIWIAMMKYAMRKAGRTIWNKVVMAAAPFGIVPYGLRSQAVGLGLENDDAFETNTGTDPPPATPPPAHGFRIGGGGGGGGGRRTSSANVQLYFPDLSQIIFLFTLGAGGYVLWKLFLAVRTLVRYVKALDAFEKVVEHLVAEADGAGGRSNIEALTYRVQMIQKKGEDTNKQIWAVKKTVERGGWGDDQH